MADLDTLRPEVREAIDRLLYHLVGTHNHNDLMTIRAELTRLAVDDRGMHAALCEHDELCEQFTAMLLRAERAEAELAVLKARIFQGVVLDVDDLARGHAGLPSEWRGKRVRLVVEE